MRLVVWIVSGFLLAPGARRVGNLALGYVRQVSIGAGSGREILFGVGIGLSVNAVPGAFEPAYGGRWPPGFSGFLSTRPGQWR